jgi:hypothetical protein
LYLKSRRLTVDNTLSKALRLLDEEKWLQQILINMVGEKGDEWKRQGKRFARMEQCWIPPKYQLYLHTTQEKGGWIKGFDLEAHLKETGLLERCFSLEDELVKNWIANPTSYPEEFKRKAIFLWGSRRDSGVDRSVAYLIWRDGEVLVDWSWLDNGWDGDNPALLAQ